MKFPVRILFFIAAIILISGCKEVFYPEIEPSAPIVVVEGLITDQPGPYEIRLTYTSDYYSGTFAQPIEDAGVWVLEEGGESHRFTEVRPGYYRSPVQLQGVAGKTYILEFETTDGMTYRSKPQTLLPSFEPGDMLGKESIRTTTRESNSGELIVTERAGVDASLQLTDYADNPANIRFKSEVKLLYVSEVIVVGVPEKEYCWKEMRRFEGIDNINLPTASNQPGDVSNNVVAFLPHDKEEYFLDYFDFLQTLAIKVRVFSLNTDAYNYYLELHKQLTSDGSIFAPIPSQMSSNIYCVTDANRAAAGLFETSSVGSRAYILRQPPHVDSILFEPTGGYDEIPGTAGCSLAVTPPFWIY